MNTLLSIITMYQYDPTVFDDLVLPPALDPDLVTDSIMLELGELELLYNDPSMMKFAIGRWSSKELKKWNDLYATTVLDYNPIENYNRTDDFTDTETRSLANSNTETRALSGSNNETRDLAGSNDETKNLAGSSLETRDLATGINGTTDTTDSDVQGGTNSSQKQVAGYNSNTLQTSEVDTQTLGATNDKTVATITEQLGTDTGTVTMATTDTGTDNTATTETGTINTATTDTGTVSNAGSDTGTVALNKIGNAFGNIGVTTTQQMIQQEREVVQFNIYDYITESFKNRFCILVY